MFSPCLFHFAKLICTYLEQNKQSIKLIWHPYFTFITSHSKLSDSLSLNSKEPTAVVWMKWPEDKNTGHSGFAELEISNYPPPRCFELVFLYCEMLVSFASAADLLKPANFCVEDHTTPNRDGAFLPNGKLRSDFFSEICLRYRAFHIGDVRLLFGLTPKFFCWVQCKCLTPTSKNKITARHQLM